MNRKAPLIAAVAAALTTTPAMAQTDGVAACRALDDDALRLACYDGLFGKAARADSSPAAVPVAPAAAATPAPKPASPRDEDFGREQLLDDSGDEIRARLVGTFDGWSGSTEFELDNGQVWRQLKNNARPWSPRDPIDAPMVTIEKGMMGSYKLRVDGVNRIVLVKRVR